MILIACVAASLVLAVSAVLWRRTGRPSRTGAAVDYGPIAGTQLFDAELAPIPPSRPAPAVLDEPSDQA